MRETMIMVIIFLLSEIAYLLFFEKNKRINKMIYLAHRKMIPYNHLLGKSSHDRNIIILFLLVAIGGIIVRSWEILVISTVGAIINMLTPIVIIEALYLYRPINRHFLKMENDERLENIKNMENLKKTMLAAQLAIASTLLYLINI